MIQAQADRSILGGFETVMHCWFWHQCELCAYSLPGPLAGQVASRSALNTGDWWEKGCAGESLQSLRVRMEFCRGSQRRKIKKIDSTYNYQQTSSDILPTTTGCVSQLTALRCNAWSSSTSLFVSIIHTACAQVDAHCSHQVSTLTTAVSTCTLSSVKPKSAGLWI